MSFRNPVYPFSFPDPFVLKYRGEYWGYCTGFQLDGRVFGIIRSRDLVHWDYSGGAMDPLPGGHTCYWAPEVTYEDDGGFLMYYSVGNEENMVIRVARAAHPAGPFHDMGRSLTKETFAIDAHVFRDDDGSRYLFYATDFLEHTHIGTGTVCDRMLDPFTLAGQPQPVTRAKHDWQIYDPKRESKGGVRWHTVEGPFVLKRKSRYAEMFSGGNWQNLTYGVSFALSDAVMPGHEWEQHADGMKVLPILRTIPDKVVGPGHNSVVLGPDNRQLYCVYHVWHDGERVLAIDKLDWAGNNMLILGPTFEEQSDPIHPVRPITQSSIAITNESAHDIALAGPALIVFWVRLSEQCKLRLSLESEGLPYWEADLSTDQSADGWQKVRLEIDGCMVRFAHGEWGNGAWQGLTARADKLVLRTHEGSAEISALEITRGFEDLFEEDTLELRGWQAMPADSWSVANSRELLCAGSNKNECLLTKQIPIARDFELVANVRFSNSGTNPSEVRIYAGEPEDGTLISVTTADGESHIQLRHSSGTSVLGTHATDPEGYEQIRITRRNSTMSVVLGKNELAQFRASDTMSAIRFGVLGQAAFEMIRYTEIPDVSVIPERN